MKEIGIGIGAVVFVCLLAYGIFLFKRTFNWKFMYENAVHTTIQDMVKPECLKEEL